MDSSKITLDQKRVKTILQSKKNKKVSDPPRYPKVSDGFENKFKRSFAEHLNKMLVNLGKEIVDTAVNNLKTK